MSAYVWIVKNLTRRKLDKDELPRYIGRYILIFLMQVPMGAFVQSMFKGVGADFYNCREMVDDRAAVVHVYVASPAVDVSRRSLRVTMADQLANFGKYFLCRKKQLFETQSFFSFQVAAWVCSPG